MAKVKYDCPNCGEELTASVPTKNGCVIELYRHTLCPECRETYVLKLKIEVEKGSENDTKNL